VPHWYVSFSFASAVPLSNGGDKIAQIVTLLLIPMCLGDDRRWHWQKVGRPLSPAWRGRAFAAHWCLRIQLCVVYVAAAISKLSDPLWRQGSALAIVSRLAHYGVTPSVRDALKPLLTSYWIVAVTGWAVICAQVVIAATLLGPRKIRMIALTLGVVLHLGIAFFMHLVSFGLIMIAVLVIACMPVTKPELDDVAYAEEENRCNA
jgi:antimicrobial peptide system SdpB family protein